MRLIAIGLALLLHGMAGCSDTDEQPGATTPTSSGATGEAPVKAMAELRKINKTGSEGGVVGWINFTELAGQLTITIQLAGVTGVNATAHGIHVHANGDCGGDGTTAGSKAGGHFNPDNTTHGAHAGDLGNITTDQNGRGTRTVLPAELEAPLTLSSGTYGIMGRTIVMHANPDDGVTNPAGNSGARVLCGVINMA